MQGVCHGVARTCRVACLATSCRGTPAAAFSKHREALAGAQAEPSSGAISDTCWALACTGAAKTRFERDLPERRRILTGY